MADGEADVRPGARAGSCYVYPTSLPYQYSAHVYNLHFPPVTVPVPTPVCAGGKMEVSTANVKIEGEVAASFPPTELLPELPLCNTRYVLQSLRNRSHGTNATAAAAQNHNSSSSGAAAAGLTPAQLSYSSGMTLQQRARLHRMPKMPAFAPPVKMAISSSKAARLAAILCASDSEDERVHIPKYRRGEDIGKSASAPLLVFLQ